MSLSLISIDLTMYLVIKIALSGKHDCYGITIQGTYVDVSN
jgi:hypothetical protein